MSKKICLFTAHPPNVGGGGSILRSLIENLPEFDISWYYIHYSPIPGHEGGHLGIGIMDKGAIGNIYKTGRMLADASLATIDLIVKKLLAIDCRAYWIVSHNEGLRIALELTRLQIERPVHLTVHDDWAGALCARSVKYRFFDGLAKSMTIETLKRVFSYDVVSKAMQVYYQSISSRTGNVCHRYIRIESMLRPTAFEMDNNIIRVGHIGSIYDNKTFFKFLTALQEFAASQYENLKPEVHTWGWAILDKEIPTNFKQLLHRHNNLPESQVLELLSKCDFVYSMYPFSQALSLFSRTSLPTKLSSYIQSGRPILGHGPTDSSVADFLETTGTGVLWGNQNKTNGISAIEQILRKQVSEDTWHRSRITFFGEGNLDTMRRILNNLTN